MTDTELSRIVDELDREHSGDPWHGTPLMGLLDGVDHVQASTRPVGTAHTIWEIVLHITSWKKEVQRRTDGAAAGRPEDGDWPTPPGPTAENWAAATAALTDAHRALVAAVGEMPESRLFSPTNDERDRETGQGVSYYVLLHGIVQHDAYHSGQIALLKKAVAGRG